MFKYRDRNIDIIEWKDGFPWPEKITVDGVEMEYKKEWASIAGKQIIYYHVPNMITRFGVPRLTLQKHKND